MPESRDNHSGYPSFSYDKVNNHPRTKSWYHYIPLSMLKAAAKVPVDEGQVADWFPETWPQSWVPMWHEDQAQVLKGGSLRATFPGAERCRTVGDVASSFFHSSSRKSQRLQKAGHLPCQLILYCADWCTGQESLFFLFYELLQDKKRIWFTSQSIWPIVAAQCVCWVDHRVSLLTCIPFMYEKQN